ncbi:MAG: PucR family transcriptional regulator [Tissierellia bacterium]|nr:PucR family transcriptional regulator [Tissierellia bacterium]
MYLLIKDLLQLESFKSITYIAGKKGSSNKVTGVGLLDYELDVEFRDQYVYENLYEGLLCLTTFLYAKDQDYLILEAIKKLHNRRCSGLVIKNIYNLPISAKVIRYADSIHFPVFLIDGNSVLFENIILEAHAFSQVKSLANKTNELFDRLLHETLSAQEVMDLTRSLVPSLKNHYKISYFYPRSQEADLEKCCSNQAFCFKYYRGYFYISSSNSADEGSVKIDDRVLDQKHIGISDLHHFPEFFQKALREAYYASTYALMTQVPQANYSDLGVFQLILSNGHNRTFSSFSNRLIHEIKGYDALYNSELLSTLTAYIMNSCDLDVTSSDLKVHKNTIKYRLDRLRDVTGLDYRSFKDLETLSLSVKIYLAHRHLSG